MKNVVHKPSVRNGSVELLRCLLMFLIVLQHNFSHGIFLDNGPHLDTGMWCLPFAFIWWHVDAFVAISGWYGIKFKWSKFLRLYGLIFFYSILSLLYQHFILHEALTIKQQLIYGGWFGATYMMLMLMAPVLNAAVEALVAKGLRVAFFAWIPFALGVTLNWSPYTRSFTAVCPMGGGAFSILNLVFVYVTARLASQLVEVDRRKLIRFSLVVLVGGVVLCGGGNAISYILRNRAVTGVCWGGYSSYDAPHIWLFAVAIVMCFAKFVRLPRWLSRLSLVVGPSTFAIFLLHHATRFGRPAYYALQSCLAERIGHHPMMILFFSAVIVYSACLLVDLCRRLVLRLAWPRIQHCLQEIDYGWRRLEAGILADNEGRIR